MTNDCVRGAEIVPGIFHPDARINAGSVRTLDSTRRPRQEAAKPAVSAAPAGHTSAMPPQRTLPSLLELEQNTLALLMHRLFHAPFFEPEVLGFRVAQVETTEIDKGGVLLLTGLIVPLRALCRSGLSSNLRAGH